MTTETPAAPKAYGRTNPYPARLTVNRRLNPGSEKDTRHLEVDLTGWGLSYEVGDSLAVYPLNDPPLVEEILTAIGASGEEMVPSSTKNAPALPLREALLRDYRITQPTPKFLKAIAERASAAPLLKELLHGDRKHDLDTYLHGLEMIDFLLEHPSVHFTPEEFIGLLAKLQPRLYSIASSLKLHPDQVHLTVDVVRYESHGRVRKAVCSSFLAERADNVRIPVFPSRSKFRLPENPDTPIIMVGPGTGIAPFRAFLAHRNAGGARGRNWLFFGDQKAATDFLYESELKSFGDGGTLTKLSTAFSRDQKHKVYVQTRMLEEARELWQYLEQGAHFYVCGDAKRMASDVDHALKQIVAEQGGMSAE